eukprot:7520716-Alexandrium_andersonii.AAC.1
MCLGRREAPGLRQGSKKCHESLRGRPRDTRAQRRPGGRREPHREGRKERTQVLRRDPNDHPAA